MKISVKILSISLLGIFLNVNCFAQADIKSAEPKKEKAKSPGDKITQFWFVMIKTGPKKNIDSVAKAKLFEGHMANINKLYYEGILKVAGPFGKNDFNWRGLFIFDCKTKEEVEGYVNNDPAVAAGIFVVDIVPWYGEPIGSFKKGKPEKTEE